MFQDEIKVILDKDALLTSFIRSGATPSLDIARQIPAEVLSYRLQFEFYGHNIEVVDFLEKSMSVLPFGLDHFVLTLRQLNQLHYLKEKTNLDSLIVRLVRRNLKDGRIPLSTLDLLELLTKSLEYWVRERGKCSPWREIFELIIRDDGISKATLWSYVFEKLHKLVVENKYYNQQSDYRDKWKYRSLILYLITQDFKLDIFYEHDLNGNSFFEIALYDYIRSTHDSQHGRVINGSDECYLALTNYISQLEKIVQMHSPALVKIFKRNIYDFNHLETLFIEYFSEYSSLQEKPIEYERVLRAAIIIPAVRTILEKDFPSPRLQYYIAMSEANLCSTNRGIKLLTKDIYVLACYTISQIKSAKWI